MRSNRDSTENLHSAMCSLETVVTYSGIAWEPERVDKITSQKRFAHRYTGYIIYGLPNSSFLGRLRRWCESNADSCVVNCVDRGEIMGRVS